MRSLLFLLAAAAALAASVTPGFAGTNSFRPWGEYHTIMWVGDTAFRQPAKLPLFFQRLKEMGIDTGTVHGQADPQPFLENRFPYYAENMVNRGLCLKWNSKVTDWDKFVTGWVKAGRPDSALVRDFCLDDPEWNAWARRQAQELATRHGPHQPLAYNLRDELSTTISANPFDYDFNPIALAGFRDWLRTQYATLSALNAEWQTSFATWGEVRPFTTDQIKARMASDQPAPRGKPDWAEVQALRFNPATARKASARWNFSPWADFRSYMDVSLARALAGLREAIHQRDPATPVGIEGTQMPHAFGGYDLWRLAQAVDWVEPYDIGNAREIFGSFMPGRPVLTTVFEKDTRHAQRRLWHLLLEGDRGCIIWWSEDCIDWTSPDYALTPKARALAPVLREMTSPLARLFLRAERERDPVYLHYSQPSIQVDWLLESTVDGSTWLRRFSSFEAEHNRQAKIRNAWLKVFQDLGYSPRFISSEQIENGELRAPTNAVVVLPASWALSDKELAELKRFVREPRNGTNRIFADGWPGVFDEHGKLRGGERSEVARQLFPALDAAGAFAVGSSGGAQTKTGDIVSHDRQRLNPDQPLEWADWVRSRLPNLRPAITATEAARARVHRFRAGAALLVAIERNIDYQMSEELKQAGGNESLEKEVETEINFASPAHLYDLRARSYLGYVGRIRFKLDPWQPSLFALTREKVPPADLLRTLESGL